jgi:tripartite-type tricarboxylate transporter receptor subunit TctC
MLGYRLSKWCTYAFPSGPAFTTAMTIFIGLYFAGSAFAQDYPARPVTMVVTFTEGSATDVFARIISRKLSEIWGQPVVVENRIGGGGSQGADAVAKSAPDGYTLLFNASAHITNGVLYNQLPYDPIRDFYPIAPFAIQPFVLVVGQSAGVKSLAELIALAKARPGQIKFGSAGVGSGTHFCAEKFKLAAGIEVVHVPLKGPAEANAATVSGQVMYWLTPVSMALQLVQEGKLIALAVAGAKRSRVMPNVPTMAQAGIRVEDANWFGMWAPAGIPDGIADRLVKDVARAIASPDVREQITRVGADPMSMTQAEFAAFVRSEMETADRIMKVTGIKPFPR